MEQLRRGKTTLELLGLPNLIGEAGTITAK